MADLTVGSSVDALRELYQDLVWNLAASSRTMRLKLSAFTSLASDLDLVATFAEALRLSAEHADALQALASRTDRPARVHAAELESLLGTAARLTGDWQSGRARDVALALVLRTATHLAIPSCELAMSLAAVVGYPAHRDTLSMLRSDLTALDARLRIVLHSLVLGGTVSPSTIVAEAEDTDAGHGGRRAGPHESGSGIAD